MPFAGTDPLFAPADCCAGLILAGGEARRMGGGDKGRHGVAGRPMLPDLLETLAGQGIVLALSANGPARRFADLGLPVLADAVPGLGPLGGLLTGLDWAAAQGMAWLLTAPCDTPFLPKDLLPRLAAAARMRERPAAVAASGGSRHPVAGLWSVSLRQDLRRFLLEEGGRRMGGWAERCGAAEADWPAEPVDPFFNVNHPADLAAAEGLAARRGGLAGAVLLPKGQSGHALLAEFAARLRGAGETPGGLLQQGGKSEGSAPGAVRIQALDTGESFSLMQDLGRFGSCSVDPWGLCAASAALRRAVARGQRPVLVNKFGPLEADGEGLADDMMAVMAEGLPLLTTVSITRLEAWMAFCGGLCTLLPPRPAAVWRWWRDWPA
ncbi:molybdenum cofactor guanylyltransferase [mine drainage metagenome]|uniref:Molybdenum cofactor guanylyltransferase n=1 Tax=mine drainage metagenome TaxID=410659 RepID=A0A1J5S0V4_9ZZZZ